MTSRQFFSFFWLLFLFLVQGAIQSIFPRVVSPFLLIGVIYYALTEGPVFGAVSGCFAGFLLDILGLGKLGGSMTLFSLVGILAGFSSTKIFYDSVFTQMVLPVLSHFVICLAHLFFIKQLPQGETADVGMIKEAFFLSQPWWTIPASFGVFSLLKKVSAARHSHPISWKAG